MGCLSRILAGPTLHPYKMMLMGAGKFEPEQKKPRHHEVGLPGQFKGRNPRVETVARSSKRNPSLLARIDLRQVAEWRTRHASSRRYYPGTITLMANFSVPLLVRQGRATHRSPE